MFLLHVCQVSESESARPRLLRRSGGDQGDRSRKASKTWPGARRRSPFEAAPCRVLDHSRSESSRRRGLSICSFFTATNSLPPSRGWLLSLLLFVRFRRANQQRFSSWDTASWPLRVGLVVGYKGAEIVLECLMPPESGTMFHWDDPYDWADTISRWSTTGRRRENPGPSQSEFMWISSEFCATNCYYCSGLWLYRSPSPTAAHPVAGRHWRPQRSTGTWRTCS